MPVQGCTLPYSRAIPLLPRWAVRPVQSPSACTRVHFTLQESYTSTPPMGRTACAEPQCLYKGALYLTVELYLYSPYGPYGLYRASVPVQGCTLPYSRAIPLLPLRSVRPVQSLSACTRVHFTFIPSLSHTISVTDEVLYLRVRRGLSVPCFISHFFSQLFPPCDRL